MKLPRKLKLSILGRKKSKKEIKQMIKDFKSGKIIEPYCHNCGCESCSMNNHEVEYPEVWIEWNCLRCGTEICYQDNSPITFTLELI